MESNTSSQFRATKKMLLSGVFSKSQFPMDYSTWNALDFDYKAAALFVNYYRTITLAWSHFVNPVITTDDAVDAVLFKLHAIVPKLSEELGEEMYTPQFIYIVCKNAIMDKSKSKSVNERYHKELSETILWSDETVDIFDIIAYYDEPIENTYAREALWAIIEGMGPKAMKEVDHMINGGSLKKTSKRSLEYHNDMLAEITVTADEYSAIVKDIQHRIAPLGFAWGY